MYESFEFVNTREHLVDTKQLEQSAVFLQSRIGSWALLQTEQ